MLGRLKGITFIWMLTLCALALCVMTSGEALAQKPIKPPQKKAAPKTAPPPPAPAPVQAKESAEDESRQIYFDYAEARPKKAASFSGGKPSGKRTRRYVRKTVKPVAQTIKTLSQVGVTLWRLRPSSASDDKETRILEQEEDQRENALTPVRVEVDTLLNVQDKVRLSVESPRAGYLYVIDREIYADGTRSAPYLIFPTLRTRGGDNKVSAGMLIDIPDLDDRPNYFTVKHSRPDQVGEELTMIVSDRPLDIPPLQRKYMKLDEETVSKWERDWKTEAERFEMEGGAGLVWTKEEKAAANTESSRLLDQDDPAPQTIYRVASKPGNPLMVIVPLRYPSMVK